MNKNIIMDRLAWSDGSKPSRSTAKDKNTMVQIKNNRTNAEFVNKKNISSLNLFNNKVISDNTTVFKPSHYREEVCLKMGEREPIQRMSQNPFLDNKTYLEDLYNEEQFLRPKTNYQKNNLF